MKRFALVALAVLSLVSTAYAVPTVVQWIQSSDFVYGGTSTDQQDLTLSLQSVRTALLYGQYHGLRKLTAVPAAPSSGTLVFNLSGVGLCQEDTSAVVTTLPGGNPVTTYPADAGYATVAVDGGTALRSMVIDDTVTETDGGALYTFGTQFNAVPICTAANQTAIRAPILTPSYTTLTVAAGSTNKDDVIAFHCSGYR